MAPVFILKKIDLPFMKKTKNYHKQAERGDQKGSNHNERILSL